MGHRSSVGRAEVAPQVAGSSPAVPPSISLAGRFMEAAIHGPNLIHLTRPWRQNNGDSYNRNDYGCVHEHC